MKTANTVVSVLLASVLRRASAKNVRQKHVPCAMIKLEDVRHARLDSISTLLVAHAKNANHPAKSALLQLSVPSVIH